MSSAGSAIRPATCARRRATGSDDSRLEVQVLQRDALVLAVAFFGVQLDERARLLEGHARHLEDSLLGGGEVPGGERALQASAAMPSGVTEHTFAPRNSSCSLLAADGGEPAGLVTTRLAESSTFGEATIALCRLRSVGNGDQPRPRSR
jgi:hypothetical protein